MSAEPTEAEKQKLLETQQKLDELNRQANAPNPEGRPTDNENQLNTQRRAAFEKQRETYRQQAESLKTEYQNLISNPALAEYARQHPATPYEIRRYATGVTGYDPSAQPERGRNKADIDVRRNELIFGIAKANPSYSIDDIDREYSNRSSYLNPQNVTINYEGTLAARQAGFDVGSGLTIGLPETFQKDENVRLYERNRAKFDAGVGSTPMKTPDVFQPVERGIFDIGLKATKQKGYDPITGKGLNPITKTVTPQRTRKKTLRDQPDSKYSSTDFILGGSDEKSPLIISSAFSMGSQYSTTLFSTPPEPRQLTQAQVDKLSPTEYKQYQDEYKAYSAYYKRSRMGYISSVKDLIKQSRAQGRTELVITANGQAKTVPISKAYTALIEAERKDQRATISAPTLISLDETLGVGMDDMGIKGIAQTKSGSLDYILGRQRQKEKPIFTFGEPFIPISRKGDIITGITSNKDLVGLDFSQRDARPVTQSNEVGSNIDAITKSVEGTAKELSKYGIAGQALGEFGKDVYSLYPSSINFLDKNVFTPLKNQQRQQSQIPIKPLIQPETINAIGTGAVIGAGIESYKGDIGKRDEALSTGYKDIAQYVTKFGPGTIIGAGAALVFPTGSKLSPITKARLTIETTATAGQKATKYILTAEKATGEQITKRFKTLEQAEQYATKQGLLKEKAAITAEYTPVSSINILGKPIISNILGKRSFGSPLKQKERLTEAYKDINPIGRGLEVTTQTKYGRDLLTSDVGLEALQTAGKILPRDVASIRLAKEFAGIIRKYQKEIKPQIKNTLEPTTAVQGKEGEALIEKVLPTLQPIKGSFAQKLQIQADLMSGTGRNIIGDIDADYNRIAAPLKYIGLSGLQERINYKRALADATRAQKNLQGVAEKGRAFELEGTKVYSGTADISKPKFDIEIPKGFAGHGTDVKSAERILREGLNPSKRPYGMPAAFATQNPEIFVNFSTKKGLPRVVLGQLEESGILQYKKIPKRERKRIVESAKAETARTGEPLFSTYQTILGDYAKQKGFIGVTKPYKSFSPDADKYEIIFFEKGRGFLPTEIVKPSGFGIKEGTRQKVLELLTHKDAGSTGSPTNDLTQVLGRKYRYDIVKGKTPKGATYKIRSLDDLSFTKIASVYSIQGPKTEKFAGTGAIDYLKPNMKIQTTDSGFGMLSPEARLKDLVDLPIIYKELGIRLGSRPKSKQAGKRLGDMSEELKSLYPEIDFGAVSKTAEKIETESIPSRASRYGITGKGTARIIGGVGSQVIKAKKQDDEEYTPTGKPEGDVALLNKIEIRTKWLFRNNAVGTELKLGQAGGAETIAFTYGDRPGKIFINTRMAKTPANLDPKNLAGVLGHETVHDVLHKLGYFEASEQIDNIVYGKASNKALQKLAPSQIARQKLGGTVLEGLGPAPPTFKELRTNEKQGLASTQTNPISVTFSKPSRTSRASVVRGSKTSTINLSSLSRFDYPSRTGSIISRGSEIRSVASILDSPIGSTMRSPTRSPSRSPSKSPSRSPYGFSPISIPSIIPSSPAPASPGKSPPSKPPSASPKTPPSKPPYTPPRSPPGKPPITPGRAQIPRFDLKIKPVRFEGMPKSKKRKFFYTNPSDPLRAGVILAQGVPELRSKSPKVFIRVDQLLAKSRKRNKWAGLDQPQAGFNPKLLRF